MSAPIKDGGPAFPFGQVSEFTGQPINGFFNPGMTLRDWFAGQALAGLCAYHGTNGMGRQPMAFEQSPPHTTAERAYECADAMLKAGEGAQ